MLDPGIVKHIAFAPETHAHRTFGPALGVQENAVLTLLPRDPDQCPKHRGAMPRPRQFFSTAIRPMWPSAAGAVATGVPSSTGGSRWIAGHRDGRVPSGRYTLFVDKHGNPDTEQCCCCSCQSTGAICTAISPVPAVR